MDVRGVVLIVDERSSVAYRSPFPLRVTPPLENVQSDPQMDPTHYPTQMYKDAVA